jgi:hypothetical protein
MALRVCSSCRRHVRAREGVCPFCTVIVVTFAVGAGLALAACDGPRGLAPVYGGPPPTPPIPVTVDAGLPNANPPAQIGPPPMIGPPPPDAAKKP